MKRVIILGSLLVLMAGVQAQQKKDTVLVVTLDSTSAKKKSVILKIGSKEFVKSNDSTNVELQKGMIFYSLIIIAKGNYQEKQDFLREDYLRIYKSAEKELGDDFNRDSFLIFLKESCYYRFYPYNNEIYQLLSYLFITGL